MLHLLILKQSLPPSYKEHLSGVPGFRANIGYAVQVMTNSKTNVVPNLVKSALFGTGNAYVTFRFRLFAQNYEHCSKAIYQLLLSIVHALAQRYLFLVVCIYLPQIAASSNHPNGVCSKIGQ